MKTKLSVIMIKIAMTIAAFLVMISPSLLILILWNLLNPTDFWQKLAIAGIGVWLLGGLQLVLFLIFIVFVIKIIFEFN